MSLRLRKFLRYLAVLAAVFAFGLVMFGAFVRLSNAGLSCPDWPTCYGKATWPEHAQAVAQANAAFPDRPYEADKAWREQVHRMLAGTLGVLVLVLALLAARRDRITVLGIILSAIFATVGVTLYLHGERDWSSGLALLAILLPTSGALWLREHAALKMSVLALAVIIFQAMLGMWTVTLLLKPIVVMGHLLGGMTTFGLLAYAALRYNRVGAEDNQLCASAQGGRHRHCVACLSDRAGRLDVGQLCRACLRHRFSDLSGAMGAADRFPPGLRACGAKSA